MSADRHKRELTSEQEHRWKWFLPFYQDLTHQAAELGAVALKSIILLNGAAAIALLAFLGQVWAGTGGASDIAAKISPAIKAFVTGAFAGGLGTVFAYISAYFNLESVTIKAETGRGNNNWAYRVSVAAHAAAFLIVVYAYYRFGEGMSIASEALSK